MGVSQRMDLLGCHRFPTLGSEETWHLETLGPADASCEYSQFPRGASRQWERNPTARSAFQPSCRPTVFGTGRSDRTQAIRTLSPPPPARLLFEQAETVLLLNPISSKAQGELLQSEMCVGIGSEFVGAHRSPRRYDEPAGAAVLK